MIKNSVSELRLRRGVTKAHFARQIGVCPSYMTKLEKMEIQPSGEVMFRIAAYLKCRVDDVFEFVVEKYDR